MPTRRRGSCGSAASDGSTSAFSNAGGLAQPEKGEPAETRVARRASASGDVWESHPGTSTLAPKAAATHAAIARRLITGDGQYHYPQIRVEMPVWARPLRAYLDRSPPHLTEGRRGEKLAQPRSGTNQLSSPTEVAAMKARAWFLAGLAVLTAVAAAVPLAAAGPSSSVSATKAKAGQVVGYFIEWGIYGRQYYVKDVETSGSADELTVINYAFGNVAPDGNGNVTCQLADTWADYQRPVGASESVTGEADGPDQALRGNFNQLRELKKLHPDLKVLMSIGGWTFSKYFSDAALTKESRRAFVSSCIDLFIEGNLPEGDGIAAGVFDGIDVDWEWPGSEGNAGNIIRPEDKQNFTKLMHEFRRQLHGNHLLTAFLPASPSKIDAGFEVPEIFGPLSFGTVQGYDFHGTWEPTTNHQSNLYTSPDDPSAPGFSDDSV